MNRFVKENEIFKAKLTSIRALKRKSVKYFVFKCLIKGKIDAGSCTVKMIVIKRIRCKIV